MALHSIEIETGSIDRLVEMEKLALPEIKTVLLKSESPLVNFRILFNTDATSDPKGKEGLARLTASMITEAGSRLMNYKEIQRAIYPMAAGLNSKVDKEITVFTGTIHVDKLIKQEKSQKDFELKKILPDQVCQSSQQNPGTPAWLCTGQ